MMRWPFLLLIMLSQVLTIATAQAQVSTETPTAEPILAPVLAEWKLSLPNRFAFGFDSVWVPSHRSPNVTTRIDPDTNQITATIKGTGFRAHEAVIIDDAVWVTGENGDLAPIDPQTNTVGVKVPGSHPYIAYGFGSIWGVTNREKLDRIDPVSGGIITSIVWGNGAVDCNNDVLVTPDAVWVDECDQATLIKIDPAANQIVSKTPYKDLVAQAEQKPTAPPGKAGDTIWRMVPGGLLRVDPTTTTGLEFLPLTAQQTGDGSVTVADNAVWVGGIGQIERIDPATNQIDATYKVAPSTARVEIGFGSVWVAYEGANLVQRLDITP